MGEKLILGLRQGEPVSPVRDTRNLSYLLAHEQNRRAVTIDDINRSLAEATEAEMPISFLFDTGLTELNWQQIYHPNALSAVYLGVKEKQTLPVQFPNSEAIIAIHSSVNNQRVEVKTAEISCVTADSQGRKRVLSVLYSANSSRNFEAYRACFSVADSEKSDFLFGVHPDDPRDEENRLVKIPSVTSGPFFLPNTPLVSLKMSQLAQGDKKMVEGFKIDNEWGIFFGDYFQKLGGENVTIGRKETPKNTSWKMSLPAHLTSLKGK